MLQNMPEEEQMVREIFLIHIKDQSSLCPVGAIHELPLQFLKNYLPMTISQNDNKNLTISKG